MTITTTAHPLTGSPEHEAFRASVRAFVENDLNPHVDAWEQARTWPAHEVLPRLAAIGGLGLEYDERWGGQGADHSFTVVLAEELGRADCAGVPMGIAVQAAMATPALAAYGSDDLRERFLAPAMRGELVCSIAVSEVEAGSDVAGIRTRARVDGDAWVIDGSKMWITNGSQADWVCLLARTSDEPGFGSFTMILVPTSTPGFSVGRTIEKMGNHSSDTAELVLDGVRVPLSHTIGEVGRGFYQQMEQFQDERLIGAYLAVAGARRALDRTMDYLRERSAFGKPLLANQHLQYRLAELAAEVDVVHEYCLAAAARKVAGEDFMRMATIAKLKAGRVACDVADAAVQFHGGAGYAEDLWVARYFRDTRLIRIGGGADEVMLRVLSLLEGMTRR